MGAFDVPKIFVVGLGNLPYPKTRHSVGQVLVDSLARKYNIRMSSVRGGTLGQAEVPLKLGKGKNGEERMVQLSLFKSKSLMNISGASIAYACRKLVQVSPREMLVLQDSLSHKPMKVSFRIGGSANGHNGIKSIITALGNDTEFWRGRIGVRDKSDEGEDAASFVLKKLPKEELDFWGAGENVGEGEGVEMVVKEIARVVRENEAWAQSAER